LSLCPKNIYGEKLSNKYWKPISREYRWSLLWVYLRSLWATNC